MLPGCKMPEVGIRVGEKLHEVMVAVEDAPNTYEYDGHFIISPIFHNIVKERNHGASAARHITIPDDGKTDILLRV